MYTCSKCEKEVKPPQKCCEGATIYAHMSAQANGVGGISEKPEVPNNNLSNTSALIVKQMMSVILGTEFLVENKTEIFARDIVIQDTASGRKFSFTITAKEL